jgi:hypothetical protein
VFALASSRKRRGGRVSGERGGGSGPGVSIQCVGVLMACQSLIALDSCSRSVPLGSAWGLPTRLLPPASGGLQRALVRYRGIV